MICDWRIGIKLSIFIGAPSIAILQRCQLSALPSDGAARCLSPATIVREGRDVVANICFMRVRWMDPRKERVRTKSRLVGEPRQHTLPSLLKIHPSN